MLTHPLLAVFQTPYGMTDSQVHWLITFTALTAIAVLIQAIALGAIAFVAFRLIKQILILIAELKTKVYPMIDNARDLVNDSVPKVKRVTTNIADTSDVYRAKVSEIDAFITDTTEKVKRQTDRLDEFVTDTTTKAKHQTERVDGMVTNGLTSVGQVVGHVQSAVMAPVRQATNVINLLKSNIERLTHRGITKSTKAPKPVAFEGENIYTGLEDDYHA